MKIEEGNRK